MINYNEIFKVSDSYQVPEKIMEILFKENERKELFMELLKANDYNVDFDWFFEYFQDEHADRKNKKQDFTPECVANLLSKLVGVENHSTDGNYYECCAGTGGIMIKHWDNFRRTYSPFDYKPQYHFAFVEELSGRCVPFLLLNMMIRGMNGVVLHCDTLTRECYEAYFVCNTKNDHFQFSGISMIPHTETFEKELMIKFVNKDYRNHLELMELEDVYKLL